MPAKAMKYISQPSPHDPAPMTMYWHDVFRHCSPGTRKVITCIRDNQDHTLRKWIPAETSGLAPIYVVYDVARDLAILRVQPSTYKALQSRKLLAIGKSGHGTARTMYQDYRLIEPPPTVYAEGDLSAPQEEIQGDIEAEEGYDWNVLNELEAELQSKPVPEIQAEAGRRWGYGSDT